MTAIGGFLMLFVAAFAAAAVAYYVALGIALLVLGVIKYLFTGGI
jgi:hypothetical protein